MAEAKRNSVHWLVLAGLCLSASIRLSPLNRVLRNRVSLNQDPAQSGPAQSPPQHSGQIRSLHNQVPLAGRLTDLHSAPLAGVTLILRNQATGAEIRTSTSKNGVFHFASLDAASYTLDADAANLGHGRLEGIVVTGGFESRLQAAMAFEPAPPPLLQASAPPQISVTPATVANTPRTALPLTAITRLAITSTSAPQTPPPSLASVPAPLFATSAPIVAPNRPACPAARCSKHNQPRTHCVHQATKKPRQPPSTKSLDPLQSPPSTSAPLAPPTQTPPQFARQPEASTQIAPPITATPVIFQSSLPAPTPASTPPSLQRRLCQLPHSRSSKYNFNLAASFCRNVPSSKPNPPQHNSRSPLLLNALSSSRPPQHLFLPPPQHCQ